MRRAVRRPIWAAVLVPALASALSGIAAAQDGPAVAGIVAAESDALPQALTAVPGDAARGRTIVTNRQAGLCLLCHSGPFPEERFQGNLGPSLAGVGARLSAGQLRLRLVDGQRLNPGTMMPSYGRTEGLVRVGAAWRGQAVLAPQQIEDVVAFLGTLRE